MLFYTFLRTIAVPERVTKTSESLNFIFGAFTPTIVFSTPLYVLAFLNISSLASQINLPMPLSSRALNPTAVPSTGNCL